MSAWRANTGCRVRAGILLVGVSAMLSAGCARPAPAEPTAVHLRGAITADHLALDKPAPMGDAGGVVPEAAAVSPTQSSGPTPKFQIVAQRINDRADRQVTYYAVISPVDSGTDAFKLAVKKVLDAIAVSNGGPTFSASIWDQLPAAQTEVSYRSNPDLFSEDLLRARNVFNDQHLVASYVGGLAAADEPPSYQLYWFPEAVAGASQMGQWTSAEMWRP